MEDKGIEILRGLTAKIVNSSFFSEDGHLFLKISYIFSDEEGEKYKLDIPKIDLITTDIHLIKDYFTNLNGGPTFLSRANISFEISPVENVLFTLADLRPKPPETEFKASGWVLK